MSSKKPQHEWDDLDWKSHRVHDDVSAISPHEDRRGYTETVPISVHTISALSNLVRDWASTLTGDELVAIRRRRLEKERR